jgi:hypothetical protein
MPVYDDQYTKPKEDIHGGLKADVAQRERLASKDSEKPTNNEGSGVEANDMLDRKEGLATTPTTESSQEDTPFNYRSEGKPHKLVGKLKKRRNKIAIGLIGGGIVGVAAFIIIIVGIIGTLLIPQLAQHITEYEFARVTRQFAQSAEEVTDEKLAIDTISTDSAYDALREAFVTPGGATDQLLRSLDQYRPSQAIKNLEVNNDLKLNYTTTATGRSVLDSVGLDGVDYATKPTGWVGHIPILGDLIEFKNGVSFSQDFVPALEDSLRANDVGTLIRSSAAKDIREKLGISLVAWVVGKYTGKTPAQARIVEEEEKAQAIDEPVEPETLVTGPLEDATSGAETAEENALSQAAAGNTAELQGAIDNNGVLQSMLDAISNALSGSGLKTFVSIINPAYAVAMPVCIVYDGSLNNSGATIDNQTRQQQAAFYYIESAADQQKAGDTNGEAVGAANADLDPQDINESIPEERAVGDTIDTSNQESAEVSNGGQYTLLNATLQDLNITGANGIAAAINAVASKACPTLTNLWAAAGLGIGNIVLGVLTFGTSDEEEAAAGKAADTVAEDVASSFASHIVSQVTSFTSRIGKLLSDSFEGTFKSAVGISAATVMAKVIVLNSAMQTNSGLAQGVDLANEADSGGNIQAGMLSQQINYGRPLSNTEIAQNNELDKQDIAYQTSQESLYQRYFAFSNADSLISRFGTILYSDFNSSFFSSMFSDIGKIFSPLNLISKIFGSIDDNAALAQAAADTTDYGNVQFGWSPAEEALISSSSSYSPVENQHILDTAPEIDNEPAETYISSLYNQCFTDSIGTLMSQGLIVRDKNGNVIADQGLCSPDNLGTGNLNGLVFRWRLAMSYQNTLTILTQESGVSTSS